MKPNDRNKQTPAQEKFLSYCKLSIYWVCVDKMKSCQIVKIVSTPTQ